MSALVNHDPTSGEWAPLDPVSARYESTWHANVAVPLRGASLDTLARRVEYGGRKGRSARRRILAAITRLIAGPPSRVAAVRLELVRL